MKPQTNFMFNTVRTTIFHSLLIPAITIAVTQVFAQSDAHRMISFGTTLDPQAVISDAQLLAESLCDRILPNGKPKVTSIGAIILKKLMQKKDIVSVCLKTGMANPNYL